jgi:hypothetical protein
LTITKSLRVPGSATPQTHKAQHTPAKAAAATAAAAAATHLCQLGGAARLRGLAVLHEALLLALQPLLCAPELRAALLLHHARSTDS